MITVIGGSGFIGTRLCQSMASRQIAFEIIDLKQSPQYPEKTTIADICDIDALRSAITGSSIINLAAVHRDDVRDKKSYYSVNVEGTRNICAVAAEKAINQIVFTSSVAVYGFAEPDTDETGNIMPFNDYGKSKYEGEEVLREWFNEDVTRRKLTIVRPTVVFGEGNRGNVYNLLKQITSQRFLMVGPGTNRKSMAYVGNVVAFLQSSIENGEGYELFNYVDKPDLDMNTLVSAAREQVLGKTGVGPQLPYAAGLFIGYIGDLVTLMTGKPTPISSIRVKKFCTTTAFDSREKKIRGFKAPLALKDALYKTIEMEFLDRNTE